jgi:hypothetical protein
MVRSGNFIQGAIRHPGRFTAYCKRTGSKGVNKTCIERGMHSPSRSVEKEAVLANTLRHLHHNKR